MTRTVASGIARARSEPDPPSGRADTLRVAIGQASVSGRKRENQDFHGAAVPAGARLALKGIVVAIADGISTSEHGRAAAESAVRSVLGDYYDTPDSWSARTAMTRVIGAANGWLHMQSRHVAGGDVDRGYVTTLSALLLKGRHAHLFHVGDSRIYRVFAHSLEPLTEAHRRAHSGGSFLSRALGIEPTLEIDYRRFGTEAGDLFLLATDGVHDHVDADAVALALRERSLDEAAERLLALALERGAQDNLTAQFVRVDTLPIAEASAIREESRSLPVPTELAPGSCIDGYRLVRALHEGPRSTVYLATGPDGAPVALKVPAADVRDDEMLLERFAFEEWIARRVASPHVLAAPPRRSARSALYVVTEYLEGSTLRQWMLDDRASDLDVVRGIATQLVRGLRAMHRREIVHQDLRPENVMIGPGDTVTIIDLGSSAVAGVAEAASGTLGGVPGTWQYTAPELLCADAVSWRADQFALGVILYEMLTGRLPYGSHAARVRSRADQRRLRYRSARADARPLPLWVDEALRRAVHPDPLRRYDALSELLADLHRPGAAWRAGRHLPLAERHPVRFWQGVSLALACVVLLLAVRLGGGA